MKLIWNQFVESPSLKNYQELKAHARKVRPRPDWPAWRDKALAHLRGVIAERKASKRKLQRTIGIGPVMPTTRVWLKSFSGKSAMTRRGRKPLRVAVHRVFGFALLPRVKKNTRAMRCRFTKK